MCVNVRPSVNIKKRGFKSLFIYKGLVDLGIHAKLDWIPLYMYVVLQTYTEYLCLALLRRFENTLQSIIQIFGKSSNRMKCFIRSIGVQSNVRTL